jgi:phosphatidylserine/phosphatidylglycerophosphate/cardiolipin synthase-like enzyme
VSELLQKKHRTHAIAKELLSLHPRIHVLRHGSGHHMYWSHHDKIVCVDQAVAFVGGIDLTEGRRGERGGALEKRRRQKCVA